MPYIKSHERNNLATELFMLSVKITTVGQLTYVFYKLALGFVKRQGVCYQNYALVLGALTSVQQEFYRKEVSQYEDEKELENGSIDHTTDDRRSIH